MSASPRNRARHYKHWTEREEHLLSFHWGSKSVFWIARLLDREPSAVYEYAQSKGLGAADRGKLSVYAIARRLGFSSDQVVKMATKLGLTLHRGSGGPPTRTRNFKRYAVTEDQQDLIEAEFIRMINTGEAVRVPSSAAKRSKMGEWGTGSKPPACVGCGTTASPHKDHGRCSKCSTRYYRAKKRNRPLPPDFSRDNERFEQILTEIDANRTSSA